MSAPAPPVPAGLPTAAILPQAASHADEWLPLFDDDADEASAAQGMAWRILVVDDDADVHSATRLALRDQQIEGRGVELLHAHSADEAWRVLSDDEAVAVVLLDVVMETPDAGLQLVRRIRDELGRSALRIILRTGQPGYAPELETLRHYDINDYRTKAELTRERLFASLTTALRAFRLVMETMRQRDELRDLSHALAASREAEREAAEQRLQAERALREAQEGIERQVELRTRVLAQAVAELEGFNRMVSHDLRGPLHGLASLSGMARRELEQGRSEQLLRWLDAMERQCKTLAQLVSDLLDLARSASGPIDRAPVDLGGALDEALQFLALSWGDTPRDCVHFGTLPVVAGDAGLLRQVFINLVGYALKFGVPGLAPLVRVSAEQGPGSWTVSVQDNGVGFPAERAGELFQPFARLHGSLHEGTGIGLTVVKRIVERHGGTVDASSEPGRGACFRVTLPG